MDPRRPILRYHGGKWKLAPWIISHFPPHRIYVEPFGGAASVLLRKWRSYAEVYNDLDGEVVNLFRVARDSGKELKRVLQLTPFARTEYEEAWFPHPEPIEQARRTVIRAYMGFGSAAVTMARNAGGTRAGLCSGTGFRSNSNRSGTTPAHDWENFPDALDAIISRLQGVVIENRNGLEIMAIHDADNALHYLDPPYTKESRDAGSDYVHEMDDEGHRQLCATAEQLKGAVILSGYDSALYRDIFQGWQRFERKALADGARKRTEVIWMNKRCVELSQRLL
jgi:DNA adenine methylase